jgi:hypothetical protein
LLKTGTAEIPVVVSGATSAFSKLGTVLGSLASTALTMGASILLSMAFEGAVKWIYETVTATDRAIEAGQNAKKTIQDINDEYQKAEESTKELGDRYNELRKGVSFKDKKGYSNLSLSDDEYKEFLDINKQLIELYPQLYAGTDAQGNAYVNLGEDADKATAAL